MLVCKRRGNRGDGSGMVWPGSRSSTPDTIGDVFGFRPFAAHSPPYDYHRGDDVPLDPGTLVYSPITGCVTRHNHTWFTWDTDDQLDHWTEVDTGAALSVARSGSALALTCARVGAAAFPADVARYEASTARINPHGANDWGFEIEFASAPSITGGIGIGIFKSDLAQYAALEYDGSTFTVRGVGTATFTANGTTSAQAGKTWMRVTFTQSTDTYTWSWSTDGTTWTNIATESGRSFTSNGADYVPLIYWRSADTNVTPYAVSIAGLGFWDLGQAISSRYGNHLVIANASISMIMMHFQTILVSMGDRVQAGQTIARCGRTGADSLSGRILDEHVHIEIMPSNGSTYDADAVVNVLRSTYFPRTNVSNNVGVVRTTGNNPDAVDSHILTITVTRADQDFDLNSISLTGNLATRTVNFNTRAGINPANNDNPSYDGVYFVPSAFDLNSAAYVVTVYFAKTTVGATFVSYSILDCDGVTLASE